MILKEAFSGIPNLERHQDCVAYVQSLGNVSGLRACRTVGQYRSAKCYWERVRDNESDLTEAFVELARI